MIFLLALGANLPSEWGKPAHTLSQAIVFLSERICAPSAISDFYATPAYPAGSGPEFVNAVVALDTEISPKEVLRICHSIEEEARRTRDARWGPRTLDIDLIACDAQVLPDRGEFERWMTLPEGEQGGIAPETLILPHPRLQDRAFVLVPMMDVAPDWVHPVLRRSTAEMLDLLPDADRRAVRRIEVQ